MVRVNERIMYVKLVIGKPIVNIVSVYAPQVGLSAVKKEYFWDSFITVRASRNNTYTKSRTKHIHYHYAPSVTLTHTTHIISSNCTHTRTTLSPLDLWTEPAGVTKD